MSSYRRTTSRILAILGSALVLSQTGCKSSGSKESAGELAAAPDDGKKLHYTVTEYQGKIGYKTKTDLQMCTLRIFKDNQDGKVKAVTISGGTRDFELGTFEIGGPLEPDDQRIDMKNDFERQPFKELEGFTRIAHSEESLKKSITWSGLIVTDIAIRSEKQDVFGSATGTRIHRMKLVGGIVKDDTSYERETVMCDYVKKTTEKQTDDLGVAK